jgi:hypothetical protein
MSDATTTIILASFGFGAIGMVLLAGLRGWRDWIELKRLELAGAGGREPRSAVGEMIEIADLKERIRKLETIASCIDP